MSQHHRRTVRTLLATGTTVLALSALSACGDDNSSEDAQQGSSPVGGSTSTGADSGSASASASATDSDSASATPTVSGAKVTVLGTGSGAKRLLQLDVAAGEVATTDMTMKMSMGGMGGGSLEIPVSMKLVTTVDSVDGSGIHASMDYQDVSANLPAGMPGSARTQMDQVTQVLEDASSTATYAANGSIVEQKMELPSSAPAELKSMVDQFGSQSNNLAVPFPDQPVGKGASWKATNTLSIQGVDVSQSMTYTLTSLQGDDYAISVKLDQANSGAAGVKGNTTGSGSYSGQLSELVPEHSEMTTRNTTSAQGMTIDMTMDVTMDSSYS